MVYLDSLPSGLGELSYHASRGDVLANATRAGCGQGIVDVLSQLPACIYANSREVLASIPIVGDDEPTGESEETAGSTRCAPGHISGDKTADVACPVCADPDRELRLDGPTNSFGAP
ncbi:DUF2795 domain-containing protein [Candidatus Mycobacterium wuenschmannii]|uniref:DUF2795 domain-containing protein n=1 Tax=Candidatus Mycobacterium wuenschmannii TaxID=3027808 RepID=A0ABY8VY21_9MYCO|nr:DUF2795 domain-containing protein [Candidatus Mycobacterium wuenschmannii]WIM88001.1 DUF2795 domain-containing protein [Candidatus Mycobacterium wuenschmannii]